MAAFSVGFCGGSGIGYGVRLVEVLLQLGHTVHLCATPAAGKVLQHEAGRAPLQGAAELRELFAADAQARLFVHDHAAVEATPSSGSAGLQATILIPCSMGTLARVAHGFSGNLVERSADVALKERRTLIVVPRETPLSRIHLQNMLTLRQAGATILFLAPGFYHGAETVDDLVAFMVGRALDQLGLENALAKRWGD